MLTQGSQMLTFCFRQLPMLPMHRRTASACPAYPHHWHGQTVGGGTWSCPLTTKNLMMHSLEVPDLMSYLWENMERNNWRKKRRWNKKSSCRRQSKGPKARVYRVRDDWWWWEGVTAEKRASGGFTITHMLRSIIPSLCVMDNECQGYRA